MTTAEGAAQAVGASAVLRSEPQRLYAGLRDRVVRGRERFERPLTLAEKVLVSHLRHDRRGVPERGRSYEDLDPDRVALQDALAQIVALQFMTAGLDEVVVPTTVHCDHLIRARTGAEIDLGTARHRQRRGVRVPPRRVLRLRHRLLGAGLGDHPPGRARELRLPRWVDDRHRQPHPERGGPGDDRRRGRWW